MHSVNSRTSSLFKKYYDKTASPQEIKELYDLLKLSADDELTNLMRKEWEELENVDPLFSLEISERILKNILSEGGDEKAMYEETPSIRLFRWPVLYKSLSVAAAILIILSVGLYFWPAAILKSIPQIASAPVYQDIPPGGNKAILTLADGQRIILDSAHNGIIAKTKSFEVVKTENGQLVYNAFERNYKNARAAEFNIISTPRGGEYRVILPDGSKVWLNAASSIKFPGVFKGNIRMIELQGEAYFEIAKNAAMPFRVKSKSAEIEVLGTHFNVKAYANEKVMKTTLLEGSVKITMGNSSHLLKPGQLAILTSGKMTLLNNVDVEEQIAWKNGLFQFKDADIDEVMQQAALWYDLKVSFQGKIPKKYFTGKVSRNVNATEFMNMLKYTGVRYKMAGKNIEIIN